MEESEYKVLKGEDKISSLEGELQEVKAEMDKIQQELSQYKSQTESQTEPIARESDFTEVHPDIVNELDNIDEDRPDLNFNTLGAEMAGEGLPEILDPDVVSIAEQLVPTHKIIEVPTQIYGTKKVMLKENTKDGIKIVDKWEQEKPYLLILLSDVELPDKTVYYSGEINVQFVKYGTEEVDPKQTVKLDAKLSTLSEKDSEYSSGIEDNLMTIVKAMGKFVIPIGYEPYNVDVTFINKIKKEVGLTGDLNGNQ